MPESIGPVRREGGKVALAASAITMGCLAAYRHSFSGPFVFDDLTGIAGNPGLGHLWPGWAEIFPPRGGLSLAGRPVPHLTLAINHWLSGTRVWGYHAVNLAVHLLASLALFGIVRRTLARRWPDRPATGTAMVAGLIWALHPIQTEAVTYVIQRTELLMGLFYLLTLYCFIRNAGLGGEQGVERVVPNALVRPPGRASAFGTTRSTFWAALSILACLLGMATKEVMVTAPVAVLLYDRTFVAGTFGEAWRRRRGYYLGLAATWIPLAILVAGTGWNRGGTAGAPPPVAFWSYAPRQFVALGHYARLCLWPRPLVFDYGMDWPEAGRLAACSGLAAAVLLGATLIALRRGSAAGFLGAWFFLTLAPTTSIVPIITQPMAEHRVYLALGAAAVLAASGGWAVFGRWGLGLGLLLACFLGLLASRRNEVYRTARTLWADTVAGCPGSARAHNNLGSVFLEEGNLPQAIGQFEAALRLRPGYAEAHNNLGNALAAAGRTAKALAEFEIALRMKPGDAEVNYNLGNALAKSGRAPEAIERFRAALRIDPDNAEARNNLGNALARSGRVPEAIGEYEAAIRIRADFAEAQANLGVALCQVGRVEPAVAHFEAAVRLRPDAVAWRENLRQARAALAAGASP